MTLRLFNAYARKLGDDVVRVEVIVSDDAPTAEDTPRLRDETLVIPVIVARGLIKSLTLALLTPDEVRDRELFDMWRNRTCPDGHALCFGVSPLYRPDEKIPTAAQAHRGCATPDELVLEVARHHTATCPCWKHAVLREYARRLQR